MERFELRNKYRKITVDGVQRKKELLVKVYNIMIMFLYHKINKNNKFNRI